MWILEPFVSSSQIAAHSEAGSNLQTVYMIPNKSYIVGRKRDECEVFVDNDKSISRKHAVLTVGDISVKQAIIQNSTDQIIKPNLSVEDFSKYGTFVVKGTAPEKLVTNTKTDLSGNWRIRFGVYQSIYVIKHEMMMFCVSRLNESDRKKLATQCKTLDAKYSTIWSPQCTHLVVDENDCTITEKIGMALLQCIPIITMQYVSALESCLTLNLRQTVILPNIENFYVSTTNSNWRDYPGLTCPPDFKPNILRKTLFARKQFVTLNVQVCEKLMSIIENGGGTIEDCSDFEIDEKFVEAYSDSNCIIIENSIQVEKLEKLKYYGYQLFNEKAIMASILMADASSLVMVNKPCVPPPKQPSIATNNDMTDVDHDEDRTDDELEIPEHSEIEMPTKPAVVVEERVVEEEESTFEPPLKKTKTSEQVSNNETTTTTVSSAVSTQSMKEERPRKTGRGIEIPLSLAADDDDGSVEQANLVVMEEPKKITPKKEQVKVERREVKKERVKSSTPIDPDEPTIVVEYINLIKVKDESKTSCNSQTGNTYSSSSSTQNGYNAKRFRKVKYDGSTISKPNLLLTANSSAMVEDSVNFDAEVSTPTKPKEIKLVATIETKPTPSSVEKKEKTTNETPKKKDSNKKETTPKKEKRESSSILDAIGLDDDEDDDDDEPTLLGVKRK